MKKVSSVLILLFMLLNVSCDGGSSGDGESDDEGSTSSESIEAGTALASLSWIPEEAELDPQFSATTTSYTLTTPDGVSTAGITAQAESEDAVITYTLDGTDIDEATATMGLEPSDTAQELAITVTSGDNSTVYIIGFGTEAAISNYVPTPVDPEDNTSPAFNSEPTKADSSDGFTISADIDEDGTLYYIAAIEATTPTPVQVRAGKDANGNDVASSGSLSLSANNEGTKTISGLSAGTYTVFAVVYDINGNSSDVKNLGSVTITGENSINHLIITEVVIGTSGESKDEFIEIYNPTSGSVDLKDAGYRLYRLQSGGANSQLLDFEDLTASLVIDAGGYVYIANDAAPSYKDGADAVWADSDARRIASTTNGIYLTIGTNGSGTIVDLLAFSDDLPSDGGSYDGIAEHDIDSNNTSSPTPLGDGTNTYTDGDGQTQIKDIWGSTMVERKGGAGNYRIYRNSLSSDSDDYTDWIVGDEGNATPGT